MKQLLLSVLVIIAVSQYFWHEWTNEPQSQEKVDQVALPDYQIKQLIQISYNQDGHRQTKLKAENLEYYQELEFTYFQHPEYVLYSDKQESSWILTANESGIYDNRHLELEGNVLIKSTEPTDWLNEIKVSRLNMDLTEHTINSKAQVQAHGNKLEVVGKGLQGNLKTKEFELTQHVQATYLVK
ncbi:LPS export ABC transporter periplasmic protein LptC [Catenovulum sp. 2E275]|uniref:LPS export ABC transporter periplasmic protein LptC n=1 Tax=Catenovulum sp. 2E275 TaxID=2980497 RepID=UPI0021CE410E|nr:LPS export ABC transporter periplasmic protein LptC [Catenovulum sp. 2E275]MCU4675463.1 LPS export ABC transporter periplasmic protein LptC [Catenovulum sp. 2E275]